MTDEKHVRASKMLARALRHEPEKFGIELDAHGWAQVGPLVRGMSGKVEFSAQFWSTLWPPTQRAATSSMRTIRA